MNYKWAMQQLRQGKRVRRAIWPTHNFPPGTGFDSEDPYWAIWHIWHQADLNCTMKGWGGSIGGDPADYYPDLGNDGSYYKSSRADRKAIDWEFYEDRLKDPEPMERAPEQIINLDGYPQFAPVPSFPIYLAAAAFIVALMVGAILYFPWK